MNTCPKCGRKYSAPPAMSRKDGSDICPVCGGLEALEAAGIKDEALEKQLEQMEIEAGRVAPR